MLSLQDATSRLSRFWIGQGCTMLPPSDLQIPLALMHPEVFFRLLEGESWRGAQLLPIRRPAEGRSGEHPFLLSRQLHFQVLLQGPPEEAEELYYQSLLSLGLTPKEHDFRWLDESWASPTLGGRGPGWRVRIDGLETSRLTYLQRLGGRELRPVCLELVYSLERLLLVQLGVEGVAAIGWSRESAGERRRRRRWEEELGRYHGETADEEDQGKLLAAAVAESRRALAAGLALPAYEHAVSCLRLVDSLEARGLLLGSDREDWLLRLRELVEAAVEIHLGPPAAVEGEEAS